MSDIPVIGPDDDPRGGTSSGPAGRHLNHLRKMFADDLERTKSSPSRPPTCTLPSVEEPVRPTPRRATSVALAEQTGVVTWSDRMFAGEHTLTLLRTAPSCIPRSALRLTS